MKRISEKISGFLFHLKDLLEIKIKIAPIWRAIVSRAGIYLV